MMAARLSRLLELLRLCIRPDHTRTRASSCSHRRRRPTARSRAIALQPLRTGQSRARLTAPPTLRETARLSRLLELLRLCIRPDHTRTRDSSCSHRRRGPTARSRANRKEQWLVKWKGYGEDRNTWEPLENLLLEWVQKRAEEVKCKAIEYKEKHGRWP